MSNDLKYKVLDSSNYTTYYEPLKNIGISGKYEIKETGIGYEREYFFEKEKDAEIMVKFIDTCDIIYSEEILNENEDIYYFVKEYELYKIENIINLIADIKENYCHDDWFISLKTRCRDILLSDYIKYIPDEPENTLFKIELKNESTIIIKEKYLISIDDVEDVINEYNIPIHKIVSLLPEIITEFDNYVNNECYYCFKKGLNVYRRNYNGEDKDYYKIFNVNWKDIDEVPEEYPPYEFEIRLFICSNCNRLHIEFLPIW